MAAAFRKSCQDAQPELDEIAAELSNTLSHPISITIDWDSMEPDLDDHWKASAGSTVVGWFRGAMRELLGFFDEPLGIARDAFVGLVPSGRIVVRGISRDVPGHDVNYDIVGGTGSGVEPTGCFLISKRNNCFSYSMSQIDKGLHRNTMWTHYVKLLIGIHENFVPYKREVEAELSELFGEPFYINIAVQSMLEYASDEDGAAFDEDNQTNHGGLMADKLKNIREVLFNMMEEHQPTREIFLQCCPGRVINMLWDEPHEHKTYWDTFHTASARAVFQMEKVAPIEQLSQVQRYLDGADFPPLNLTGACNIYLNPKYRTFSIRHIEQHIDEQMEDSHACMVVRNVMEYHPRRRWEAEQRLAAAFDGQQFAFLVDWTGLWNGLSSHDEPNTRRSRLGGIMTDKLERVVTGIINLIEEDDIYKQEFLKNCPNKLILMVYAEDQTGTQATTYEFGAADDTRMTAVDWWAGRYLGSMAAPYAGSLIVSVIENYLTHSPSDPDREIKKLL